MNNNNLIRWSTYVFTIVIIVISFVSGESIDSNLLSWLGKATSIVMSIWLVYEKWMWKWPGIRIFTERILGVPILHGSWKGTIKFDKDEHGKSGEAIIYTSINQTLTSILVRSYFERPSESYSITATIQQSPSGQKQLYYLFHSDAPHSMRVNNPPYEGAAIINIIGLPANKMLGSYFTSRNGSGIVNLLTYNDKFVECLDDAKQLFYKIKD